MCGRRPLQSVSVERVEPLDSTGEVPPELSGLWDRLLMMVKDRLPRGWMELFRLCCRE